MAEKLTIARPDDWHVHLRDGDEMASVVGATASQFARAIVMPNLKPPVVTTAQAMEYRDRIVAALPKGAKFEPLMTLYLTDNTTRGRDRARAEVGRGEGGEVLPGRRHDQLRLGRDRHPQVRRGARGDAAAGMPLLVHGEVTDPRSTSSTAKRCSSTVPWARS